MRVTWSTADLVSWSVEPFPAPYVDSVAATRYGLLAAGIDECEYTGGTCPPDDLLYEPVMYLSDDRLSSSYMSRWAIPRSDRRRSRTARWVL